MILGGDVGNINLGWELNITTTTVSCTTPCGVVRLVVTSTLSRVNASTVQATVRVENTGTSTASAVSLTTAKLGATNGTPLPQSLGSIAPGASVSTVSHLHQLDAGRKFDAQVGRHLHGRDVQQHETRNHPVKELPLNPGSASEALPG